MKRREWQAPIVLAHGLMGFSRIGVGSWTIASYFRGIPAYLEGLGYRVLVTRVHPTASIESRARKLAKDIEAAFPGQAVHLVGHSMGGLDAKQLVQDPAWSERILSLVTIGTPHLGSMLAERLYPRFRPLTRSVEATCLNLQGFEDIMPDHMMRWHEDHPAPDQLPCYSIAGVPDPDDVCWPLKRLHQTLEALDGPNDGLVSRRSALAFGEPLPVVPLDHFHQMNWFTTRRNRQLWPLVHNLYRQIAETVSAHDPARADLVHH